MPGVYASVLAASKNARARRPADPVDESIWSPFVLRVRRQANVILTSRLPYTEGDRMADRRQRVLVIVAHPDDAESWAGGTIAKLVRAGAQVAYCIVTNGDKGSGDRSMTPERLAATRQAEQRDAASVLGVGTVDFLGF